jgi:hypothetical protein
LAATRSQITPRDDDRELQTEQAIVGLPPRKLQPDRMDARSWFGMTFAKGSPARCAMAAVRFRHNLGVAARSSDGPFTIRFADLHRQCNANRRFVEPAIYILASRLRASWMEARATKAPMVSARFSKSYNGPTRIPHP